MSEKSETADRFRRAVEDSQRRTLATRLSSHVLRRLPSRVERMLRRAKPSPVARAIAELARSRSDVVFVQIGSCDGRTGDPLYEHVVARGWSGVVVEPVPHNFERLIESYRGVHGVACENVAISDREQVRTFHHVDTLGRDLPVWCDHIGSFDRAHLEKHVIMLPELESFIVETQVQCITLAQLLERNEITRIDILHTDVEGFDLQILEQIDFNRYVPELIIYEDLHMSDADRDEATWLLRSEGYTIASDGMNSVARLERAD